MDKDNLNQRFILLDALRCIAALSIVVRHSGPFWGADMTFPESYLAVDLFFCLSGFVMAHSYEARLASTMSVWAFMTRRLIRLYPLYLLGAVLGFVVALAKVRAAGFESDETFRLAIAAILSFGMLPGPGGIWGNFVYSTNFPAWSLLFEIFANLVYAFLIARGLSDNRRFGAIILVSFGGLLLCGALSGRSIDVGFAWLLAPWGIARVLFSFFLGVMIYRRFLMRSRTDIGQRPGTFASLGLLVCLALLLTLTVPHNFRLAYDLIVVAIVFPAIVYAAAWVQVGKILGRIYGFLGATSYAIYVTHVPLASFAKNGFEKFSGIPVAHLAPWSGVAFLIFILAMCGAFDKYYDLPVRAWLTRQSNKRKARTSPVLVSSLPQSDR